MEKPVRGSAKLPDHIMVTINGDAATQMAVTWRTSTDIESGYVLYKTADGELMRRDAVKELFVSDIDESYIFSALLTDLSPDTRYYYTCGDDAYRSEEYSFATSPENLTKFKFICVSDQQQGQPHDCPDYSYFQNFVKRILKENPDSLTYYIPKAETSVKYYEDASLGYGGKIQAIYPLSENRSNKYLCFLGGDHPITVLETDCAEERTCILIKESYGNAFSTWLTSHYSKIICIDPREFNRSGKPSLDLKEFAARVGADDCIILNYPMMLSSDAYASWLNRLVGK